MVLVTDVPMLAPIMTGIALCTEITKKNEHETSVLQKKEEDKERRDCLQIGFFNLIKEFKLKLSYSEIGGSS